MMAIQDWELESLDILFKNLSWGGKKDVVDFSW
jgi:hypothetical protein